MAKAKSRVNLLRPGRTDSNYYFILPYAKHLKIFFASELRELLKKNELDFTLSAVISAIEYWIAKDVIAILPTKYFVGESPVKKYIYVRDPKP